VGEKSATHGRGDFPSASVAQTVGSIFRAARRRQGLSQYQLADLTDRKAPVSRGAISDIERGRNLPSLEHLVSLSAALQIEPAEVLERLRLAVAPPIDLTTLPVDELRNRARELFWSGEYRTALGFYDAIFERIVLEPPADENARRGLLAGVEIDRAATLRRCGALRAAAASAKRAIEIAEGIPAVQARAYTVLASLESHEGNLTLALTLVEQAIAVGGQGDDRTVGLCWNQKGNILHKLRAYKDAHQAFLESRKLLRGTHDYHSLLNAEGNIGSCLIELGSLDRGRRQLIKAVELARTHGDRAMEASWLVELAALAFREEKLDEADHRATEALRIAKPPEKALTAFRAEWIRHRVVTARKPGSADSRRMQKLHRLYGQVREHKSIDAVAEFEKIVLDERARTGDDDA
jgi:transcriptional regulator with XRE-family HTH domain